MPPLISYLPYPAGSKWAAIAFPLVEFWDQHGFATRFEWGPEGARLLADSSDVIVVVDVISSTTCITIGCEQGARIYPYRFKDASAGDFARSLGASLAVHREVVDDEHPYSLSPATFQQASIDELIVLPSPNGATIALAAADAGRTARSSRQPGERAPNRRARRSGRRGGFGCSRHRAPRHIALGRIGVRARRQRVRASGADAGKPHHHQRHRIRRAVLLPPRARSL